MKDLSLFNKTTQKLVVRNIILAQSFWEKLVGLLGRDSFPKDTTMFFKDCPSVHTFFMKFPIDVVFLDKNMQVTDVIEDLKPWRMTKILQFRNKYCLEFYSNKISHKISKGDILNVRS